MHVERQQPSFRTAPTQPGYCPRAASWAWRASSAPSPPSSSSSSWRISTTWARASPGPRRTMFSTFPSSPASACSPAAPPSTLPSPRCTTASALPRRSGWPQPCCSAASSSPAPRTSGTTSSTTTPHHPDQPLRHDVLFAGRPARIARHRRPHHACRSRSFFSLTGSLTSKHTEPARSALALLALCRRRLGRRLHRRLRPWQIDRSSRKGATMQDEHPSQRSQRDPTSAPHCVAPGARARHLAHHRRAWSPTSRSASSALCSASPAPSAGSVQVLPHEAHEAVPVDAEEIVRSPARAP